MPENIDIEKHNVNQTMIIFPSHLTASNPIYSNRQLLSFYLDNFALFTKSTQDNRQLHLW